MIAICVSILVRLAQEVVRANGSQHGSQRPPVRARLGLPSVVLARSHCAAKRRPACQVTSRHLGRAIVSGGRKPDGCSVISPRGSHRAGPRRDHIDRYWHRRHGAGLIHPSHPRQLAQPEQDHPQAPVDQAGGHRTRDRRLGPTWWAGPPTSSDPHESGTGPDTSLRPAAPHRQPKCLFLNLSGSG